MNWFEENTSKCFISPIIQSRLISCVEQSNRSSAANSRISVVKSDFVSSRFGDLQQSWYLIIENKMKNVEQYGIFRQFIWWENDKTSFLLKIRFQCILFCWVLSLLSTYWSVLINEKIFLQKSPLRKRCKINFLFKQVYVND